MTRPALIIGVGGTGQWVLTFLKKELIEIGNGEMPDSVRLLEFDTASREAVANIDQNPRGGSQAQVDEVAKLGDVELEKDIEFISIGADLYDLATEIRDGKHPHLQWFPAKAYLEDHKLPKGAFLTTYGAGAIRQMGRLSLFNKVNDVLAHIRTAMVKLRGLVHYKPDAGQYNSLEILIVGSLAGGTGAGTIVDMAWLTRMVATELQLDKYVIRGFIVLPSAFIGGEMGQDRDKMVRSYAAWNELDRFMLSNISGGGASRIIYNPLTPIEVICNQVPFDVTYMIDTNRPDRPLQPPPKEGVFPAVAHTMSMILDEQAGIKYSEHVINILANKRANLPAGIYHSSIGSYTIKVPVYYAQAKFARKLTLDVLETFLKPELNTLGKAVGVKQDQNAEAPQGYAGYRAVLDFLGAADQKQGEDVVPNTNFLPLVREVREAIYAQKDGDLATRVANSSLDKTKFLPAMTNISADQAGQRLYESIRATILRRIWDEAKLKPSREFGDSPNQAITRIMNDLPAFVSSNYGSDTIKGEHSRGAFGDALEEAKRYQLDRYKNLLHIWTLNTLNGKVDADNPMTSRSGKLGYVQAFYQELFESLGKFMQFVRQVQDMRSETLRLSQKRKEAATRYLANYRAKATKKCWLTFWDKNTHPEAHEVQRAYLRAEQAVVDVRKDDILLEAIFETAAKMQIYANQTKAVINDWVNNLASGTAKYDGLYNLTKSSIDNVESNFQMDTRLGNPDFAKTHSFGRVIQIIGVHDYTPEEEFVKNALNQLHWRIVPKENALEIQCGIETKPDDPKSKIEFLPFLRGTDASINNLKMIVKLAEKPYETVKRDRPFAKEIQQIFQTGDALADALNGWGEPFYAPTQVHQEPAVRSAYIRVHPGEDPVDQKYFQEGFKSQLIAKNPNIQTEIVNSEDVHKLTIVRADDLMPSTNFNIWHQSEQMYLNYINDPNAPIPAWEFFAFMAEQNAAYYEGRAPRLLKQNFRKFHPEVIGLFEDKDRVLLFFLSKAHGFLKEEVTETQQKYWVCRYPGSRDEVWITNPKDMVAPDMNRATIFSVIRSFITGRDARPGRGQVVRIDWDAIKLAVIKNEVSLGPQKVLALYAKESDVRQNNSIVNKIIDEKNAQADGLLANIDAANGGIPQNQRYDDLADLAKVIYIEAASRVQNKNSEHSTPEKKKSKPKPKSKPKEKSKPVQKASSKKPVKKPAKK